ncbi:hypothetical protein [Stenotrophomonas maltophilia]|uniref:hypothetical protein n=1 Tax=Stenotrophomonas maltophilia TaxID=40324 RepID=UPI002A9CEC71|nr:hypothetical protein [Stenotrophomonas maltophilia]
MNRRKKVNVVKGDMERFHTLAEVSKHFSLPEVEVDVSINSKSDYPRIRDALQTLIVAAIEKGKPAVNSQKRRAKAG